MRLNLLLFLYVIVSLFLTACGPPPIVFNENLKNHPPKVILILPPENTTIHEDVEEKLYPIIYDVISNKGYYCLSPQLVKTVFEANKLNEPGRINEIPVQKFKEVFNADAILKTRVLEWDVTYMFFLATITVSFEMELIDAQSDEVLWSAERLLQRKFIMTGNPFLFLVDMIMVKLMLHPEDISKENLGGMVHKLLDGPYYDKWNGD